MKSVLAAAVAIMAGVASTPAAAVAGFAVEANGARADGDWGGELGLGYRLSYSNFHLTPAVGAFVHDDHGTEVSAYGRVEASFSIPLVAEIGAGARISSDHVRPYGTVALPLAPLLHLKANAGKGYYALGIVLGR